MIRINLIGSQVLTAKEKRHAYYLAHPEIWEKLTKNQKERRETDLEYRTYRRQVETRYRKNHPEKIKAKDKRVKTARRSQPYGKLDYIIRNARSRAQKKGITFDDALLKLAVNPPTNCACCEQLLNYESGKGQNIRSPSLDRLDPRKGYTVDNVSILCMRCNQIKNDGTAEDHRRIANYIDRATAEQKQRDESGDKKQ